MESMVMTLTDPTTHRQAIFEEFYKSSFPAVASFVRTHNGELQDAKDIFQDALIIYMEKMERDPIESPQRYLLGIAKHLWTRKFRHDTRSVSMDEFEAALTIPAEFFHPLQSDRLLQFLESTGKRCLDLLRAFYYEQLSMKDIASSQRYGSEHSASVQKYKCLEKMRQSLKDKSLLYEDFFE